MQNTQHPTRALARLCGFVIGALGFLLSLALAMTMFILQGNPGFMLIWLAAVLATGVCLRVQNRWRKSYERMYSPETVRTFCPARKGWKQSAEDIAFRDIPDASMSFSQ